MLYCRCTICPWFKCCFLSVYYCLESLNAEEKQQTDILLTEVYFSLYRKKLEEYGRVQQCCRDFFMDFVSVICFSPTAPFHPDQQFVKELMQIIFSLGDSEEYKGFYPLQDRSQECPIIRTFLLQFLLEYRYVIVLCTVL